MTPPVLVLGVGNILLEDEGIGVRVVEQLAQQTLPPEVELLDGGTAGMELLDLIARREVLILVDAVRTGAPPGTCIRLGGDEVPAFFRQRISPHQLGISEVLATLGLTGETPAEVVLIGVVPERMGTGLDLSPLLTARLPELAGMVLAELRRLGCAIEAC